MTTSGMTTKSAFSPEDCDRGATNAGMIVITAAHGGMFRETMAMAKAYAEARAEHGDTNCSTRSWQPSPRWSTPGTTRPTSSKSTGWPNCATR